MTIDNNEHISSNTRFEDVTLYIYTFITPLIFAIGLTGNIISLKVFNSAAMKKMSASVYLSCLALADTSVLVFYVLSERIRRGLPLLLPDIEFSILDANGAWQIREYLSHLSRLIATWVIVAFTLERCVSVCFPLKTLQKSPKRVLCVLFTVCSISMTYTLFMNVSHSYGVFRVCSYRNGYEYEHFITESLFATLIFFLPCVIITLCNGMVLHTLYHRRLSSIRPNDSSILRLELILIMFAISFCYIVFHIPYYIVWCRIKIGTNSKESFDRDEFWNYWNGMLYLCRTIYYLNYCSNFILYCISGKTFRIEMMNMLFSNTERNGTFHTHTNVRMRQIVTLTKYNSDMSTKTRSVYITRPAQVQVLYFKYK